MVGRSDDEFGVGRIAAELDAEPSNAALVHDDSGPVTKPFAPLALLDLVRRTLASAGESPTPTSPRVPREG
jgi:hypothetical protein